MHALLATLPSDQPTISSAATRKTPVIMTTTQQQQAKYDELFHQLAIHLSSSPSSSTPTSTSHSYPGSGGGSGKEGQLWEVRQEKSQPRAYIHVSRNNWLDHNMNGIHLEAYVLDRQIQSRHGVVALHCEGGWPINFRRQFVPQISNKIRHKLEEWNHYREYGKWELMGHLNKGMSICEVQVPFGASPDETMERIERQLRRLMTLSVVIDEVIDNCCDVDEEKKQEEEGDVSSATFEAIISKEKVRQNDGLNGRSLWTVIDGYVVDATEFAKNHPGGLRKILATDEKQTGWTGEEFGFSLTQGQNAHFPKTGRIFEEGVRRFDMLQENVKVNFGNDVGSTIIILGKLQS